MIFRGHITLAGELLAISVELPLGLQKRGMRGRLGPRGGSHVLPEVFPKPPEVFPKTLEN
eukprot:CAMPEP_0198202646 /NCGR_PEP_ID=MMETSP1445-20131203/5839_1 /TAXON_ID=36898 /ORGANISM="Pyramimonas sp., Strain CCMP2087" /LENGTH=59 /DNA_ID=CAMNT_0043873671 /DNA_START=461 /DNA_END=640 /DNA_ORIENTATION=-